MEASNKRSSHLRIAAGAQRNPSRDQQRSERELLGKLAAALARSDAGNEHPTSLPAALKELGHGVSPPLVPKSGEAKGQPDKGHRDPQGSRAKTMANAPSLPAHDPSLRNNKFSQKEIFRGHSLIISIALAMVVGLAAGAAWPWKPGLNSSAAVATQVGGQTPNSEGLANVSFSEITAQLHTITQELSSLREEMKALATRQDQVAGAQDELTTAQARLATAQEEGAAKQNQTLQAIAKLIANEQNKQRSPVAAAPKRVTGSAATANVVESTAPQSSQQDHTGPIPPMPVPDHYIPLAR
jgi:hypothetical protein